MRFGLRFGKTSGLVAAVLLLLGAVGLISSETPPYAEHEKAYYADQATVNFVRPGLTIKILSHQIAADGTVSVRYKLTDPRGLPLDRLGVTTPGTVSTSFILASIPKGQTKYVAYTTRVQISPINNVSATQAAGQNNGTFTPVAEGEYNYTFSIKLPSNYDKTATHTIGAYGSRNLSEFDLSTNYDDDVYNFVPDGSKVEDVRDVIKTATCNKCHFDLGFHGGSRKTMEVCVLCHTPQTSDPDTGNPVDMATMVHKIHTGKNLPSVKAGKPYVIIGNASVVHDYSEIGFSADGGTKNCTVCHEKGKGAKQEMAWATNPTRADCGSCHDTVKFATGEGHFGLPFNDDVRCRTCHIPQGEVDFDASIMGAHTIDHSSQHLMRVVGDIVSVENNRAGQKLAVNFTLKDKLGNTMEAAKLNRVALTLSGPSTDFVGIGNTGYVTEVASAATLSGSTYKYTFNTALPADAKGTYAVGLEARRQEILFEGTQKQRTIQSGSPNEVFYFSVDGSKVTPRRVIADDKKCDSCHGYLAIHGENRNQYEYCVMCHNPKETDAARRPANAMPAETINMALMIHRIHSGHEQIRDYTIYGYGNTPHNYNKVGFPAPRQQCSMCHAAGTENLPVKAVAKINDPRGFLNPVYPATGACLGCHTSTEAASHALVNTTTLGESCTVCHGPSSEYSVARAHAR